jgi:solute carrier family 25 protein 33/36
MVSAPPSTQSRELGQISPKDASTAANSSIAGQAQPRRPWAHFVAGGVGGMTAATLTCPLDGMHAQVGGELQLEALPQTCTSEHALILHPIRSTQN